VSGRVIRLGVAGLGRAFTLMLPTLAADRRLHLVAAADPRAEGRRRFETDFGARSYETVEALCADPNVEAVYIATPHQLHAHHVGIAAAHGKHVLVEKPMAITLAECAAMIEASRRAGIHLIVGHSHSFNAPILHTRRIIASGAFGPVRMIHALNYTDYMYRPRRPEELVTAQGGGVVFSQGAHQIDIVRLLGGGQVQSVRAATGAWDPSRPTEGAYAAFLTFADGAFASATYSGFAHFDSDEFCDWIGEMGLPKDRNRYGAARKALQQAGSASEEAEIKAARNYGGKSYVAGNLPSSRLHQHFGTIIVSCDRADLRPTPQGVVVYDDVQTRLEATPVPAIPRAEVIDELYDAVVNGRMPLHSGEWAMATIEVCLAILDSQRTRSEIALKHQIVLPGQSTPSRLR
jgi:phthalate 4,5-cis-dihydrodiol dehydrogenase